MVLLALLLVLLRPLPPFAADPAHDLGGVPVLIIDGADDHRRAKRLAEGLAALDPSLCDPAAVQTNILFLDLTASGLSATEWSRQLAEHGVICRPSGATTIRLLTHADVADAGIDAALAAFRAIWPNARARAA